MPAPRAKHVTAEQAQGFHRLLRDAETAAEAAAELDTEDPYPWIVRLIVAQGLGKPHDEFRALWAETVRRDPANYAAHASALQYWCAKWCGSDQLMNEFADEAARNAPVESLLCILPLRALIEEGIVEGVVKSDLWRTPRAQQALDTALAAVDTVPATDFRLGHLRNALAYGLCFSGRHPEALEQFRLIGGYVAVTPWSYYGDPKDIFNKLRAVTVRAVERQAAEQPAES